MIINVYTTKNCGACLSTKLKFQKLGIRFNTFDISQDTLLQRELKNKGYSQLPVVEVVENNVVTHKWSGFQLEEINYIRDLQNSENTLFQVA